MTDEETNMNQETSVIQFHDPFLVAIEQKKVQDKKEMMKNWKGK